MNPNAPRLGLPRRSRWLALLCGLTAATFVGSACPPASNAMWGPKPCGLGEGTHCYSEAARSTHVLASIAFENTTPSANVPGGPQGEFTTAEEWISFENQGSKYAGSWIENGQIVGRGYSCCTPHAFYAEEQHWRSHEQGWHIDINEGASPLNTYNHYVLFDPEQNGLWHVYWGCCEVAAYGGGWPVWLTEQAAGGEVAAETRPEVWGRQEVAASNGGAWSAWTGAEAIRDPGMCLSTNVESSAPGNIMWATGCS